MANDGTLARLLLVLMSVLAILSSVTATQHNVTTRAPEQQFQYFTINASPASLTVTLGSTTESAITITSLNGFSDTTPCNSAWWGNLHLSASLSPSTPFGLSTVMSPSCLTLNQGQTINATLLVTATTLAAPGRYNVTVFVSFQVSPSGWSAGQYTTVPLTAVSDG